MKLLRQFACLLGFLTILLVWITPATAYMGNYISATEDDMAIIATIKRSDIEYDSDQEDSGDIDRKIFSIGVVDSINSKIRVSGSLNYTFDGDLPINYNNQGGADLSSGFSLSAGGSYAIWAGDIYSLKGYGQFNYIFDETYEYSGNLGEVKFDGYELIFGILGGVMVHPQLYFYSSLYIVPLNDFTLDFGGNSSYRGEWDIERDQILGITAGFIYDLPSWFLKAEMGIASERAFGLSGGYKF